MAVMLPAILTQGFCVFSQSPKKNSQCLQGGVEFEGSFHY